MFVVLLPDDFVVSVDDAASTEAALDAVSATPDHGLPLRFVPLEGLAERALTFQLLGTNK